MLQIHNYLNPVAITVAGLDIYWYSFAYIAGIVLGYKYAGYLCRKFSLSFTSAQLESYVNWLIIAIIVGGRLGYILFYDYHESLINPLKIFRVRSGGMSFHGGLIGVSLSSYFYCKKYKLDFVKLTDVIAVVTPIGLFFGRLANFVNAELYGKITNVPWAVIFPDSDLNPRHPSQLYEAFLEGIVLFLILNIATYKYKSIIYRGRNSGILLVCYGIFRLFVEHFREADIQIGYFLDYFTLGQLLCVPMIMLGTYLIRKSQIISYKQ